MKRSFIDLIIFIGGLGIFIVPVVSGLIYSSQELGSFATWIQTYSSQYWFTYIAGGLFIVMSIVLPIIRGRINKQKQKNDTEQT